MVIGINFLATSVLWLHYEYSEHFIYLQCLFLPCKLPWLCPMTISRTSLCLL